MWAAWHVRGPCHPQRSNRTTAARAGGPHLRLPLLVMMLAMFSSKASTRCEGRLSDTFSPFILFGKGVEQPTSEVLKAGKA